MLARASTRLPSQNFVRKYALVPKAKSAKPLKKATKKPKAPRVHKKFDSQLGSLNPEQVKDVMGKFAVHMHDKLAEDFPPNPEHQFRTTPVISNLLAATDLPHLAKMELESSLRQYEHIMGDWGPGIPRALKVHQFLDGVIEEEEAQLRKSPKYVEISCRKGCSHCCHKLVSVTTDEAILLTNQLKRLHGGTIPRKVMETLRDQAQYEPKQDRDYFLLPQRKNRCVFLNDLDECSVYQNRPYQCRTLRVRSNPVNCSQEATKNNTDTVIPAPVIEAEVVASAFIELEGKPLLTLQNAILNQLQNPTE